VRVEPAGVSASKSKRCRFAGPVAVQQSRKQPCRPRLLGIYPVNDPGLRL
jgi:hypothetical protein